VTGTSKAGTHDEFNFRITDCLEKRKGKWVIVHQHLSFPVDLTTGKADVLAKP
jgi:ketosteroid isomerase-like protein